MFRSLIFIFVLFSLNICNSEIISDDNGNKYITIGSSKDEVLEVLGTPSAITSNCWWYSVNYINFDSSGKISTYSGAYGLKIRLLPKIEQKVERILEDKASPQKNICVSTIDNTSTSNNLISSSTTTSAKGYGEISNSTGRAKTVHVNGYTKKNGTYVSPHYRSPPRKK